MLEAQPLPEQNPKSNTWTTVTPLSKYAALMLFVLTPFVGGYVGYSNAPKEIVEVEKVILSEKRIIPHSLTNQKRYSLAEFDDSVEVYVENNLVQKIDWDRRSIASMYTQPAYYLITDMDMNFDGINDVGIMQTVAYGGANRIYDFYIWNTQTRKLEKEIMLSNLSNPSVNHDTETITTNMRGMPYNNWSHAELMYENGTYEKGRVWDEQVEMD